MDFKKELMKIIDEMDTIEIKGLWFVASLIAGKPAPTKAASHAAADI